MRITTDFVIPFCFGFIASRAQKGGDMTMLIVAIIGILADMALMVLMQR